MAILGCFPITFLLAIHPWFWHVRTWSLTCEKLKFLMFYVLINMTLVSHMC